MIYLLFVVNHEYLKLPKVYSFEPGRFEIRRFGNYRNVRKHCMDPKARYTPLATTLIDIKHWNSVRLVIRRMWVHTSLLHLFPNVPCLIFKMVMPMLLSCWNSCCISPSLIAPVVLKEMPCRGVNFRGLYPAARTCKLLFPSISPYFLLKQFSTFYLSSSFQDNFGAFCVMDGLSVVNCISSCRQRRVGGLKVGCTKSRGLRL